MVYFAGIDVAKETLQLALCDQDGEWIKKGESAPNTVDGWKRLRQSLPDDQPVVIGFEASGGYEYDLMEWIHAESSLGGVRLNPYRIKAFAESQGKRSKTDAVDARTIALFTQMEDPDPDESLKGPREDLRELTRHLEHLREQKQREENYAESATHPRREEDAREAVQTYDDQIDDVKEQIKDLIEEHPELESNVDFLTSIPGINEDTAWTILSELQNGDQPESLDPKQEVAHCGLDPQIERSGTSLDRSSISKRGNPLVRKKLYFPTLSAIQHNPIIEDFYERLIGRGKEKMVAIVACMRKLLHIAVGVLKNQSEFDPNWAQ